jgi:hypothetical protein
MTQLREELESLQRRLKWRLRLQVVLNSMLLVFLVSILLVVIDFQLRPELNLFRYLLSMAFWMSVLAVFGFWIVPIFFRKIGIVDIAFAVENSLGTETGELAAVLDLEGNLARNDGAGFDTGMLSKNILETELESPLRLRSALFTVKCLAVIVVATIVAVITPNSSLIAMNRISNPRSEQKWPRFTNLELYDSSFNKVSPGSVVSQVGRESTQFYAIDQNGDPPKEVLLEIRNGTQAVKQIQLQGVQKKLDGINTSTLFEFRLVPTPAEELQFRVIGGDDRSMPWTHLLQELKPSVISIACKISPPEYLGQNTSSIENWAGQLQVPAGTALTFALQLNRTVVEFQVQDQAGNVLYEQSGRTDRFEFPLQTPAESDDRLQYEVLVKTSIENAAKDWIRVKRLQIEPVLDQPPLVTLLQPVRERNVTPTAVIPIQAIANDDHRLKSFRIVVAAANESSLLAEDLSSQQEATINGKLTIELTQSQVGETINIFAEASDFNPDASLATSQAVRVNVVSSQTKASEINIGIQQLAREISSGFRQQQELKNSSTELLDSVQQNFNPRDLHDAMNRLEARQSLLLQRLGESDLQVQIRDLQAEILINQIENSAYDSALQLIQNSVQLQILPPQKKSVASIQSIQQLISPIKTTSLNEQLKAQVSAKLRQAIIEQEKAIQSSVELMKQLGQWIDTADIQLQWDLLLTDIHKISELLPEIARETISKSVQELSSKQLNSLEDAANLHQQFSTRSQKLLQQLKQSNDEHWRMLGDLFTEFEIVRQVQDSANAIQQNNILKAIEIDQNIIELFSEFERQLSKQDLNSRAELIQLLKMLQERLNRSTEAQSDLNQSWRNAGGGEQLKQDQLALQEEMRQLLLEIENLGISQVADLFAAYFSKVESLLNPPDKPEENFIDDHTQAIEEILAQLDMQLADSLKKLIKRDQKRVLEELKQVAEALGERQLVATKELKTLVTAIEESGRLSRRQRRELLEISKAEQELADALTPFQSQFEDEPAIRNSITVCIALSRRLGTEFELGEINATQLKSMQSIVFQLTRLTQIDSISDQSSETRPLQLSAETRERIQRLLQLQEELLREEEELLSQADSFPSPVEQSFIQRQRNIDLELKSLLKEIDSSQKE